MSNGKQRYSQEVYKFAKENVSGRTVKGLALMISEHFGIEMTESKMRAYMKNHKLKNGRPAGRQKGQVTFAYPQEIIDFIVANHKGNGHQKMADLVNEKFGTRYTKGQIKNFYGRHKLNSGLTGRFKKGNIPYNKGIHTPTVGKMAETQFKNGHLPHNTKPIGYERITRDGYIEVKVRMRPSSPSCNDNFVAKHYLVWEEANGPVPKGHKLIFLDGDRKNCSLENLKLVTDAVHLEMTRLGLRSSAPKLTETGILVAKVSRACHDKRKSKKEERTESL